MTPKQIYDRKKALKNEQDMRAAELELSHDDRDLETEIMMAAFVVAMERIADSLDKIAEGKALN